MTLQEPLLDTSSIFITSDVNPYHQNDKFFRGVYMYWRKRGFATLLLSQLLDVVASAFLILMLLVPCTIVDWSALAHHTHHKTCPDGTSNTANVFSTDCYGNHPVAWRRVETLAAGWYVVLAALGLYATLYLSHVVRSSWDLWRMRQFYTTVLHMDAPTLVRVSWETIMPQLLTVCNTTPAAAAAFGFVPPPDVVWTALHVVNAITRQQNFFIALVHDHVVHFDGWGGRPFFPASLHMYLNRVLHVTIDPALPTVDQTRQLQWAFRSLAVGAAVLAPVLCAYRIGYILFRYVDEWRNHPHTAATRLWTPWARCYLREYCELDHVFEARLVAAYKPTTEYLNLVYFMPGAAVARFGVFLCGGLLALLLALAFVLDENFLTVILMGGRSVAFWVLVLSLLLAFGRSFVPADNVVMTPALTLNVIKTALAWPPDTPLDGTVVDPQLATTLGHLFSSRLVLIAEELVGLLYIPYLLAFVLPQRAAAIAAFYTEHTDQHPEMGSVCRFALFRGNTNAKMELSRYHFQHHYPQWAP